MTKDERNRLWARALGISVTEFASAPDEARADESAQRREATPTRGEKLAS